MAHLITAREAGLVLVYKVLMAHLITAREAGLPAE